jgi:hypothetical protein
MPASPSDGRPPSPIRSPQTRTAPGDARTSPGPAQGNSGPTYPHRGASPSNGVARAGTPQFEAQRVLLLEILVDPPAEGDALAELATTLAIDDHELRAAAAALEDAGLARLQGDRVHASATARAFDALWPVAL